MLNLRNYQSAKERRDALEKETGVVLPHTGSFSLDESIAGTRNCENMIGATQIPLGVAGPLRFAQDSPGRLAQKEVYIPLSTTEGALVASVNRGCRALSESGGAMVWVERIGATRGPVFRVVGLEKQHLFTTFLKDQFETLQNIAQKTSQHLKLLKYETTAVGHYVYVRFYFDTKDAMGLNMITIATDTIARFIEEKIDVSCISLSGNFCTDKKPSFLNFINKRGFAVSAEVTIPGATLRTVLKTTAQDIYDVWLAKCMIGSAVSGSLGFNAQYANVVAALFIATGQDPAHTVEGSMGVTTTEIRNSNLYISVYLPSVMVGTVGGGTGLATQTEALKLLGINGGDNGKNSERLAEIVGGAVLAGEISLLASLSEKTLARAHQRLGRGK